MATGWPLAGETVLDLSSGIAGAYCTKLLADGGADVVKVETGAGDPLRGRTVSGADLADGEDSAIFRFLAASKRSLAVNVARPGDAALLQRLAATAGTIVWTPGSPVAQHPALLPDRLVASAPRATIVAITPFGLGGPWAGRPATDLTLQAWAGGIGHRGRPDHPPVGVGGDIGAWIAGLAAGVAALTSRWRRLNGGPGELVDVSALEALCVTNAMMYPVTYWSMAGKPWRSVRTTNLPDVEPTKDGYVGFMLVTGQQWQDFCVLVERPDWLDDPSLIRFEAREQRRDELTAAIRSYMAAHTTDEIVELASLLRIPVTAVGNGATVPHFDHFVERGFFVTNPRGGFTQPDVPYTLTAGAGRRPFAPAPRLGEHTDEIVVDRAAEPAEPPAAGTARDGDLPFAGLRVADFTAFWAGPIVGNYLAMLGADVVHVESTQRPDGMRYQVVRPMSEDKWWEWTPLYQASNTNKRGLTLDLSSERGRDIARRLVAECDVVLENYTPRVMDGWGLSYEQLRGVRPDLIMVRMPAFGLSGPWRDRTGYAQTMEQISGLAWVTGEPDQPPLIPNGPCDPVAGMHALVALHLALEHRRRTGEGQLVEVAMIGGALNIAAEQVVEHSAYGEVVERIGNRHPLLAPQGVYRCADGEATDPPGTEERWVALSVADDEQWRTFRTALGDPGWACSPELDTLPGRRAAHAALDEGIAAWCRHRAVDDIVEALWSAGVPVGRVLMPHEQVSVPQLTATDFFEPVGHPVTGVALHARFPAVFGAGPARHQRRHAPTLGEHNREILGDLLGLSPEDIDTLEADGVVGTVPANNPAGMPA